MRLLAIILALALAACRGHSHDHEAAEEPRTESFTKWTGTHEFFVEHPPFVVGQKSVLAAHLTRVEKHAAVGTGRLTAILRPQSGTPVEVKVDAPARPGLFRPEVLPTVAGPCTL